MPGLKQALVLTGLIFFICSAPDSLRAGEISFSIPVDCDVGGSQCFIQNYYDHKQGPGRKDYACGRLSYDGHDGTDFRLRNYPAMREGTAVLAAAPGKVLRTRDGMPDINVNKIDPELIQDRKAGNGVVIEHGDGWVTQYSHLRQGSVQVEPGQKVEQGDELGLIGLSGNTEFPHVEFSVRYKGEEIDPFVGRPGFQGCGNTTDSLWTEAALKEMEYQATGLLSAGFAGQVPQADKARQGVYSPPGMSSRALVFWVDLFGVHKGDEQQIRIAGPDGDQLVNSSEVLKKSNVSWFAYSGLRRPNAGWQQGVYKAVYELKRDGETRVRVSRKCNLK